MSGANYHSTCVAETSLTVMRAVHVRQADAIADVCCDDIVYLQHSVYTTLSTLLASSQIQLQLSRATEQAGNRPGTANVRSFATQCVKQGVTSHDLWASYGEASSE